MALMEDEKYCEEMLNKEIKDFTKKDWKVVFKARFSEEFVDRYIEEALEVYFVDDSKILNELKISKKTTIFLIKNQNLILEKEFDVNVLTSDLLQRLLKDLTMQHTFTLEEINDLKNYVDVINFIHPKNINLEEAFDLYLTECNGSKYDKIDLSRILIKICNVYNFSKEFVLKNSELLLDNNNWAIHNNETLFEKQILPKELIEKEIITSPRLKSLFLSEQLVTREMFENYWINKNTDKTPGEMVTEYFVFQGFDEVLYEKYKDEINFSEIYNYDTVPEKVLNERIDVNWQSVSKKKNLSLYFLKEHQDKIIIDNLGRTNLRNEVIKEFSDNFTFFGSVSLIGEVDFDFVHKHIEKINLNDVKRNKQSLITNEEMAHLEELKNMADVF